MGVWSARVDCETVPKDYWSPRMHGSLHRRVIRRHARMASRRILILLSFEIEASRRLFSSSTSSAAPPAVSALRQEPWASAIHHVFSLATWKAVVRVVLPLVYSVCSSTGTAGRNSTVSTSDAETRTADTPSAGCYSSSTSHSASAIEKWPPSGRFGHSSGHPNSRLAPLRCRTT